MTGKGTLLERVRSYGLADEAAASGVRVRQVGEMRLEPGRPWMPFRARQTISAARVAFAWKARVRAARVLSMTVVDRFEGAGDLNVKVWGWVPLQRARGPEVDRGQILRYLAELPWCPAAYAANRSLAWDEPDARTLRVSYAGADAPCRVAFEVDDEGRVLAARATRPRQVGKGFEQRLWTGTFRDYELRDGLRVPMHGEATWHLDDGDFSYWRARITELSRATTPSP